MTDDAPFLRATVGMQRAVLARLTEGPTGTLEEYAAQLVTDVLTAEDDKTRYCVVTFDPHRHVTVFGPYASADSARWAIESGTLASLPNTTGCIYPLVNAPKMPRKPKADSPAT